MQTTSKELRDMIIDSGMEAGMQESMDALEEVAVSLALKSGQRRGMTSITALESSTSVSRRPSCSTGPTR